MYFKAHSLQCCKAPWLVWTRIAFNTSVNTAAAKPVESLPTVPYLSALPWSRTRQSITNARKAGAPLFALQICTCAPHQHRSVRRRRKQVSPSAQGRIAWRLRYCQTRDHRMSFPLRGEARVRWVISRSLRIASTLSSTLRVGSTAKTLQYRTCHAVTGNFRITANCYDVPTKFQLSRKFLRLRGNQMRRV